MKKTSSLIWECQKHQSLAGQSFCKMMLQLCNFKKGSLSEFIMSHHRTVTQNFMFFLSHHTCRLIIKWISLYHGLHIFSIPPFYYLLSAFTFQHSFLPYKSAVWPAGCSHAGCTWAAQEKAHLLLGIRTALKTGGGRVFSLCLWAKSLHIEKVHDVRQFSPTSFLWRRFIFLLLLLLLETRAESSPYTSSLYCFHVDPFGEFASSSYTVSWWEILQFIGPKLPSWCSHCEKVLGDTDRTDTT